MEKIVATSAPTTQTVKQSAQWYQAITLAERLALFRDRLLQPQESRAPEDVERGRQRLTQWKNQPPFHKFPQSFVQRLESDGLGEEQFLALLALPAAEIQAAHAVPPAWLEDFLSAFAEP